MIRKLLVIMTIALFSITAFAIDRDEPAAMPNPPPSPATNVVAAVIGVESAASDWKYRAKNYYSFYYEHFMGGGFSAGGLFSQIYLKTPNIAQQDLLGFVSYNYILTDKISLKSAVGIGGRFQKGVSFLYYDLRPSINYKVNDIVTWNAIEYRFRNSFDTIRGFELHALGTGVTISTFKNQAVIAKIYKVFDPSFEGVNYGGYIGYSFRF